MAKRQALLHGAACILCGALILPVSAADNLHFSGSLVASPCEMCIRDRSNGVQVTFTGTEATGMRGILAIDSHSGASGIGIGIETLSGVPVGMNDEEGAIFTLVTGNNALSLNAWVQRLPGEDLVPGTFFASALVTFEYL